MFVLILRIPMLRSVFLAALCSVGVLSHAWAMKDMNEKPASPSVEPTRSVTSLSDDDLSIQLKNLAQSRAALDQRLSDGRAACYQRFAVNDCIIQLRRENRSKFDALRAEEIALQDEQRARETSKRLTLIAQKKADALAQAQLDAQRLPAVLAEQAAQLEEKKVERKTLDAGAQTRLKSQQERLRLAEQKMLEYERKLKEREAAGKPRAPTLGIPLPLR